MPWEIRARRGPPSISGHVRGKDLFDSQLWNSPLTTSVHYAFIASLRKKIAGSVTHATPTHRFIRALRDGGRLVRCYTQNVDGLEDREDLSTDIKKGRGSRKRFMKEVVAQTRPLIVTEDHDMYGGVEVVQLHGDLKTLRCRLCQEEQEWDTQLELHLLHGEAPTCISCFDKDESRRDSGKRSISVGSLRPNIVLYGEEHPQAELLGQITTNDITMNPDALIILGTSLQVFGFQRLVREFAKAVKNGRKGSGVVIFVNRTPPPRSTYKNIITYWVNMDCDEWVEDLRTRRSDIFLPQGAPRPPPPPKKIVRKPKKQDGARTEPGEVAKKPVKVSKKDQKMTEAGVSKVKKPRAPADPNKPPKPPRKRAPKKLPGQILPTAPTTATFDLRASATFSIIIPRRIIDRPLPRCLIGPPKSAAQLSQHFTSFCASLTDPDIGMPSPCATSGPPERDDRNLKRLNDASIIAFSASWMLQPRTPATYFPAHAPVIADVPLPTEDRDERYWAVACEEELDIEEMEDHVIGPRVGKPGLDEEEWLDLQDIEHYMRGRGFLVGGAGKDGATGEGEAAGMLPEWRSSWWDVCFGPVKWISRIPFASKP